MRLRLLVLSPRGINASSDRVDARWPTSTTSRPSTRRDRPHALRDHRTAEAEARRLGEATVELRHRPHLAAQAELADRDRVARGDRAPSCAPATASASARSRPRSVTRSPPATLA